MRLGKLTPKQKRILTLLRGSGSKVSLEDLATSVHISNTADALEDFRNEDLGRLIRYGYIKSATIHPARGRPTEGFYLTDEAGYGAQRTLQGNYGPLRTIAAWFRRTFAFIFIISGILFLLWQQAIISGNVVGNETPINIAFFASLALIIIGGILLFKSLKK